MSCEFCGKPIGTDAVLFRPRLHAGRRAAFPDRARAASRIGVGWRSSSGRMSHHRLGEPSRARDYYDWPTRWPRTLKDLQEGHRRELETIRAEAAEVLGLREKKE